MTGERQQERAGEAPRPLLLEVQKTTTEEGVTFAPWTDGFGVGFQVTHPERPARYVYLNPSGAVDTGEIDDSDVFVYLGPDGDPDADDMPVIFVAIWDSRHDLD